MSLDKKNFKLKLLNLLLLNLTSPFILKSELKIRKQEIWGLIKKKRN